MLAALVLGAVVRLAEDQPAEREPAYAATPLPQRTLSVGVALSARRLEPGEVIDLRGGGVGGTYRVTDDIRVVGRAAYAAAIRDMGGVVAQTCRRDGSTVRLVGLSASTDHPVRATDSDRSNTQVARPAVERTLMLPCHRRIVSALAPAIGAALSVATVTAPAHGTSVDTGAPVAPRAATRSVDVAYTAGVTTMQRLLDRCDGPVAIRFDGIRPRLLAEHDYCGGRWVLALERGDIVDVNGGGIGGRYRVNDNIKVVPKGASAGVLRGMGAVVAQTCRADGDTMRLVGLSRID